MLFVGDDWAEDHHDVEVQDETGRRLAKARLPEGVAGIAGLHELIGRFAGEDGQAGQVVVGIETDRGPWVAALVAAGYQMFAINPKQVARYRERHSTSGAKSDAGDAHTLADMVRTDRHQLRVVAGDSASVEGIKVAARAHQSLIWDQHRQVLRLRSTLREFFPAALEAFEDLTAPDALELLAAVPDPDRAARLSRSRIAGALRRARRRDVAAKAERIQAVLRTRQLTPAPELVAGYAAAVHAMVAMITTYTAEIATLQEQVEAHFGRHPDAEIYRSQPGLGQVLAARVLGGFGDDPDRYTDVRARKNYAATSPITRASGKKKTVLARWVRNRRLADALHQQAFCALRGLTRRPGLLRPALRPRPRAPRRPAPAGQPTRRHPARLPENSHPLQRGHRLGPPHHTRSTSCCLTTQLMGCLHRHYPARWVASVFPYPARRAAAQHRRHPLLQHRHPRPRRLRRRPGSRRPDGGYELSTTPHRRISPHGLVQALSERPAAVLSAPAHSVTINPAGYVVAALCGECDRVRHAPTGQHNAVLCRAAYALGQLIGAGLLDPDTARTELTSAAGFLIGADCDCTATEVDRVITTGLTAGARNPRRTVPRTSRPTTGRTAA